MNRLDALPGVGIHTDNLERQHLQNLGEMGFVEDERGRNIEERLDELNAELPTNNNSYEDRLHLAMSSDFETLWMRKPLYDNNVYDGRDEIDPPAPYDHSLGKVIRFLDRNGSIVQSPRPWAFIDPARQRWFMLNLREMIDRKAWRWTKISKSTRGAPLNLHLEIALPLPWNYSWPEWAGGIHVFAFGEIVNTRWQQLSTHRVKKLREQRR